MNTDSRNDEPWADQRVTAFVLGELDAKRSEEFQQEMLSDPALAAAVEEASAITGQLRHWFADEPSMTLDAERREAILGAVSQASPCQDAAFETSLPASPSRADRGHAVGLRWFALAASLALVVGAVGYQQMAGRDGDRQQMLLAKGGSTDDALGLQAAVEEPKARESERGSRRRDMAESEILGLNDSSDESTALRFPMKSAEAPSQLSLDFESERRVSSAPAADQTATAAPSGSDAVDAERSSDPRPERLLERSLLAGAEVGLPYAESLSPPAEDMVASPNGKSGMGGMGGGIGNGVVLGEVAERLNDAAKKGQTGTPQRWNFGMDATEGMLAYGDAGDAGDAGGAVDGLSVVVDPQPALRAQPAQPARPALGHVPALTPSQRMQQLGERRLQDQGRGPGMAGDRFDAINENPFKRVDEHPLSTFSIDVDTAAYAKVRQYLMEAERLPRPDVVRIEELVNYFEYDYPGPPADGPHPLAADIEIAECPWNTKHRLARIAVQAKRIASTDRPPCNLVFLIDTSGSMNVPNRLPLVQHGLEMLLDKLNEHDRVAVVVYAGSAGLVLDSTPASEVSKIRRALTRLRAGGSTNGGDGIRLAYQAARDHFVPSGINRVILCTDGDFNVGTTSQDELIRLVEQQARGGIDLTVLGFGMGNHNDAMLEQISGRANGNYAFIDNQREARRVLVERTTSTLFTIARDVKIQVEFNPSQVAAYRLIGYENRILAKEDFNDDTKDAGEVGAGHSVTALYELIPRDGDTHVLPAMVDDLKYQRPLAATEAADGDEVMTVKLRYKPIEQAANVGVAGGGGVAESILVEFTAGDVGRKFSQASKDYRFAALVAAFGLQLRGSEHRGSWTLPDVLREATEMGGDHDESRAEWLELVRRAAELQVGETSP